MLIILFTLMFFAPSVILAADFGVRVILGLTDTAETKWDGSVSARGAKIAAIDPWRFAGEDAVASADSWRCSTRPLRLFGARGDRPVVANGVILRLTDASDDTTLEIKTAQGNFSVKLAEIPFGKSMKKLEERAMVDRIPQVEQLTTSREEQDYPAAARARNGDIWLTWVEFTHSKEYSRIRADLEKPPENFDAWKALPGGDRIWTRKYAGGSWGEPIAVTSGGEDLYRPAVAVDGQGRAWIFWSAQRSGNFDLWTSVIENGRPGKAIRLSVESGSDIDPAAATDSEGKVWVAWQGWRNGRASIFSARQNGNEFSEPVLVASSKGNEWNPAIAADANGRITVAWDSYRNGNYDVFLRTAANGKWGEEMPVAATPRYEAYPSIAYEPGGRLWVAFEEAHERWGKDYGSSESTGVALYVGRAVRLRGYEVNGQTVEPAGDPGGFLPGSGTNKVDNLGRQNENTDWYRPQPDAWKQRDVHQPTRTLAGSKNSYPRLHVDPSGRLWMAVRSNHPIWWNPVGTVWSEYAVSYDGAQWTGPVFLSHSDNLLDNRPAVVATGNGELMVIGSSDWRREMYLHEKNTPERGKAVEDPYNNDLFANYVRLGAGSGKLQVQAVTEARANVSPLEDAVERAAIERVRAARPQGKYRVLKGEFHRHSEVSADGGNDGSLIDQWRYVLDAADMDWVGCCDHDNGHHREYSWWINQKLTDVFYTPGRFVPLFSYERSVQYPEGHRNVIFAQRGIHTLPRLPIQKEETSGPAPDTQMLYQYLRRFNGVVASHTSGTNMGTDWRDNDALVEPFVEIYQGIRQNYERPGAPRSNSENDSIGGWRPKGFIDLALQKGYKLAFESSSDHISTHMSYANALAEEATRESVLQAFQKRHVYAATDVILAEFTSGNHIMGDEFDMPAAPELKVKLSGTAPFAKVHIIKDDNYVYATEPNTRTVDFTWRDNSPQRGKQSYYYIRGEQADGEVVWASPMWITYTGNQTSGSETSGGSGGR